MVVSLGDYRRKILGSAGKLPSDYFTLGVLGPASVLYPKVAQTVSRPRGKERRVDCTSAAGCGFL